MTSLNIFQISNYHSDMVFPPPCNPNNSCNHSHMERTTMPRYVIEPHTKNGFKLFTEAVGFIALSSMKICRTTDPQKKITIQAEVLVIVDYFGANASISPSSHISDTCLQLLEDYVSKLQEHTKKVGHLLFDVSPLQDLISEYTGGENDFLRAHWNKVFLGPKKDKPSQ